jgi:hypothetical protein
MSASMDCWVTDAGSDAVDGTRIGVTDCCCVAIRHQYHYYTTLRIVYGKVLYKGVKISHERLWCYTISRPK